MEIDIKEYFLGLLTEKEKQILIRFEMLEKITAGAQAAANAASEKLEDANERHFEAINGLQKLMKEERQELVSKSDIRLIELKIVRVEESLTELKLSFSNKDGQITGAKWLWGAMMTAVGAVIGAVSALSIKFK